MATIRKRGSRYHVQIRKKGFPPITKSFSDRKTADTFAKDRESRIERGVFQDSSLSEETTLTDLLERYRDTILPSKKGKHQEHSRINLLIRDLGKYPLAQIKPFVVSKYLEKRQELVQPATARRELAVLSHALNVAEKMFGIHLPHGNPTQRIQPPKPSKGRTRRVEQWELDQLMLSLSRSPLMKHIMILAIETGMRRGEICRIILHDINLDKSVLRIPDSKNGNPRTIPLSDQAKSTLTAIINLNDPPCASMPVVEIMPDSITQAFNRACKRAGIDNLRFHDLRHEATSRFFEKGLNVMEVASITGHQDLRMLRRYTHIRAETLVDRL